MLAKPNLMERNFVSGLWFLGTWQSRLNLCGVFHESISRKNIQTRLDKTYQKNNASLDRYILGGALGARHLFSPVTCALDALWGTGRYRDLDHIPTKKHMEAPVLTTQQEEHRLEIVHILNADEQEHQERLDWLMQQLLQMLHHPCDAGLVGLMLTGVMSAMTYLSSMVGAAVGLTVGSMYYVMQLLHPQRRSWSECVRILPRALSDVPTLITGKLMPAIAVSIECTTVLGFAALPMPDFVTGYMVLQAARLGSALLKTAITGLGATAGLLVGSVVVGTEKIRQHFKNVEQSMQPTAVDLDIFHTAEDSQTIL